MRPSSPLLDSVRDLFEGHDQMARDFAKAFVFSKEFARTDFYKTNKVNHFVWQPCDSVTPACLFVPQANGLFDVCFLVGQGKAKTRLYGVRSILGVRSRQDFIS